MNTTSITKLKENPTKIIQRAVDYPVAVESRNQIKAYVVGKDLFEDLISYLEDISDRKEVESTDFEKGRDFDKVAEELGV